MLFGDRLGLAGAILTLFALAATILWPDKRWIGWVSLSCATGLLVAWIWLEVGANLPDFRFRHPALFSAFVFIVGGCLAVSLVRLLPMKAPPLISKPVVSAPKLVSSIDQVYIAGNTKDARTVGETLIILVVTIQNTGDPTTVVDYRLEVDIPNRARPEFFLAKIPDTLNVPGRTKKDKRLVFYASDSLPEKTFSTPLTKDAPVRGIVVFVSTSVKPLEMYNPGVGLSLIFKDVKGLYYKMAMSSLNLGKPTGQSFVGLRSGPTGK
jgi:hypothetical protein